MRISLFGIGYAGSVSAACLARDGHDVIAVDTNAGKVAALNRGEASLLEPGLEALILAGVRGGRLCAVGSVRAAVAGSALSIVCVGTPPRPDGTLDLEAVARVAADIGAEIGCKGGFHVVVIRSTLPPGAMAEVVRPAIEAASGLAAGHGFGLAYYPELLREGSAIADYDAPSLAVLAVSDDATLDRVLALQPRLKVAPAVIGFEEAEAVKLASNVWRAVKVSPANEIGGVLAKLGLDSHRVMATVVQDALSSSAYLTPGFAFGGSCLPKDLCAFVRLAEAGGGGAPVLTGALLANEAVIERAVALVEAAGGKRVSIFGLAFKPDTDDVRESPFVHLAERLIAKGYGVRLFDPAVRIDRLTGANQAFAAARLPDLVDRLCDTLAMAVRGADTLVLAHKAIGAAALDAAAPGQRIVDLARVRPELRTSGDYVGLSW